MTRALLATIDWSATPLGTMAGWPESVRSALAIVLHAQQPMAVVWGADLHILYNDSYRAILGARAEPPLATFGQPVTTLWPEAAGAIVPVLRRALAGYAEYVNDALFVVERNGAPEDLFLTVSTSPLIDTDGVVAGVFCTFADTTALVVARRERDAALAELGTAGERLRLATDIAELGTFDHDLRTDELVWSATTRRHFGVAPDAPLDLGTFAAAIHPDDRVRMHAAVAAFYAAPGDGKYAADYRTVGLNDGQERWLAARGQLFFDAAGAPRRLLGTTLDITARKHAEAAAHEVEARLRLLDAIGESTRMAAAPDAIMEAATRMLGEYLHVTRVAYADLEPDNDRFTIRHDWTAPGAFSTVGVYSLDLFGPRARASMRAGHTLQIDDVDRELTAAEGADMFNQIGVKAIICCPLVKGGKLVAMMAVHQDSPRAWRPSELALVEAVVERCWAHIERVRAVEALRDTDRRKSEFLAVLAHELRNPLAPIRNGIDMLRLSANNPQAAAKVRDMMERQVTHMVHLINDLLDVARVNNGKVVLQMARVDLRQVLANAVEACASAVDAARHVISVDAPAGPVYFDADPVRLAQVLGNLLSNAVKYTPPGGRLQLSGRLAGDVITISLQDNGIGIPAEHQGAVFDMFTQVSRSLEQARGGLGIGLSLVQRLVELHGGTVAVASGGLGQGSRFTVRLPAHASGRASIAPVAGTIPAVHVPAAPLRILVADDNVDAADTLCALLDASGYITRIAYDGAEALEAAKAFLPDVALLDLGMPRMDGFETARAMRALPALQDTVLVAVTGWGAESDRDRSRAAGFDHHLLKPAAMQQVEEIIASVAQARAR